MKQSNLQVYCADFRTTAEYWMFPYESPTFRYELEGVWEEVRPLYELLHAYVRRKLRDLYGPDKLSRKAPLPAHILGMSQNRLQQVNLLQIILAQYFQSLQPALFGLRSAGCLVARKTT